MNNEEMEVSIDGMHCVSCAQVIEKAVRKIDGVESASVDYPLGTGAIHLNPGVASKQKILQAIKDAGYHAEIIDDRKVHTFSSVAPFYDDPHFQSFALAFLLTLPLLINMFGEMFHIKFLVSPYAELVFATIVQFWCGRSLFQGAWSALKARVGNMDLLVIVGSLAAYIYSCYLLYMGENKLYFETGAFIITVVLFGRWIEGGAKEKAQAALLSLSSLRPKKVQVERMGELIEIRPEEVRLGELFFIKPGEVVAVDGVVIQGHSSVREEAIFGELVPTPKDKGDKVYAGTVNVDGLLKAKAEKVGSDTVLEHVIVRAKKLHTTKAPIQRLADEIAEVFVPAILATGLGVFLIWWWKTGAVTEAVIPAIATVLIACPCAIGMATPIALLIASGLSAKSGLLFHDARALELASKMQVFAFDKTGTITEGMPHVEKVLAFNTFSEKEVLQILASLETFSTHPVAEAIIGYARKQNIEVEPTYHVKTYMGKGIEAQKRGEMFFAGSLAYARENGIEIPKELEKDRESLIVALIHNRQIKGAVLLKDVIRPYAKEVVEDMKQRGIYVTLLSGDKIDNARMIASRVGIERVRGEVLPDKKVDEILLLKDGHKILGMCGDGINDAFALAAADVGFSMASGSDLAIESSDVTLMKKDLRGIIDAIDLSQATLRKIKQNLFLASIYNIVAIPIAASGLLNPMVAATAMVASSLSVVVNALFLRSWNPPSLKQ